MHSLDKKKYFKHILLVFNSITTKHTNKRNDKKNTKKNLKKQIW